MNKPMYCPMAFDHYFPQINRCDGSVETLLTWVDCNPNCAWAVNNGKEYGCIIVLSNPKVVGLQSNIRPLPEDYKPFPEVDDE